MSARLSRETMELTQAFMLVCCVLFGWRARRRTEMVTCVVSQCDATHARRVTSNFCLLLTDFYDEQNIS